MNDGALAYKGTIPPDRWADPYMPEEKLRQEMASGVEFWGCEDGAVLAGVMGIQEVADVVLIRHAYVRTAYQKRGIGGALLAHLRGLTSRPMLIGTWADAVWAIGFYRAHGFAVVSVAEKERLLRTYWKIPERQVETSVVLTDERWRAIAPRPADGYAEGRQAVWMVSGSMSKGLRLPRFSIGVGDRFAHQAKAQLRACVLAADAGVQVVPVWNKSNREHLIIGSEPRETRAAADAAVAALGWAAPYFLDADHINLKTVERFLAPCDFFTLDVADLIGQPAKTEEVAAFVARHPELMGTVAIPGVAQPFLTDEVFVTAVANKFLAAVQHAGAIYRLLVERKGAGNFVPEVSMDETDAPQTPVELLIILAALADEGIPIQTVAPKFTGRFNKGVDYVGEVAQFTKEFEEDLAAIAFAVKTYGLPDNLKLSVHSGSDKFSIYPAIHAAVMKTGAGVHLKTAGTTWLEELIGLAEAGSAGLEIAKEVYREAYAHRDELCQPYATVIDIDPAKLPAPEAVTGWTSGEFTSALRHDRANAGYNPSLRQLLHVGFKVAAKMGSRYLEALEAHEAIVAKNVTENLFERHIKPVFLGAQ